MKKLTKLIIYLVLFIGLICPVYGQSTISSFDARFVVQFSVGKSEISSNFISSNYAIEELKRFFHTVDISMVDSISIIGSSSPEGGEALNLLIAHKRAESLRNFIKAQYSFIPFSLMHLSAKGDTWADMIKMIKSDPDFPNKNHTLIILDSESNYERRFELIEFLEYNDSYDYLYSHIFPRLRNATAFVVHYKSETPFVVYDTQLEFESHQEFIEKPDIVSDLNCIEPATIASSSQSQFSEDSVGQGSAGRMRSIKLSSDYNKTYKPLFALKTNLLFDAATILNLEIEVPIGDRWSIAGEIMFPWWLRDSKQNCLQVISGTLEGRYWFGDRSRHSTMTGWFAGVHVGGGYYDIEWERKGYQGEFFLAAGVSGGYAHTINKRGNLRMEYSIGIGYLSTNYRHYEAKFSDLDNSWHLYRQSTGQFSWFGPTRAKVSLVWMLETNRSKNRGGRR